MNTTSHAIDFYDDRLEVLVSHQEEGRFELYVAMRPVCEGIGLAWSPQCKKLKEHHRFSQGIISFGAATMGGEQDALFLHKPKFFLWLYSINPDKVAKEIRPKLIKYQDEVEVAIDRYFTQGMAVRPDSQRGTEDILQMISSQAKMISTLAEEMYSNRRRIERLEGDVGKMKTQLSTTPEPSPAEPVIPAAEPVISARQAQILRDLAKAKGKTKTGIMKLWRKFKDHFEVERYVHLPASRFHEARQWFEHI